MLSDFITNHLNWQYDLTIAISGGLIATVIIILFPPVFRNITKIRELWVRFIKDPNLNIEVSVSSYFKTPIDNEEFNRKIKSALVNAVLISEEKAGIFKFAKKMDAYDVKGGIFPVPTQEETQDDNEIKYGSFTIIISTQNMRLKKLKEGLLSIQNFIFRDLFININKEFIIDVDINNEGIAVNFSEPPHVLQSIKDLNVSAITAYEDGLKVTFSKDKLKALGKFDPSEFDKIERIVKSNILAQHI